MEESNEYLNNDMCPKIFSYISVFLRFLSAYSWFTALKTVTMCLIMAIYDIIVNKFCNKRDNHR